MVTIYKINIWDKPNMDEKNPVNITTAVSKPGSSCIPFNVLVITVESQELHRF